jgi:hypothetical protein
MHLRARLARENAESGWELAGIYTTEHKDELRVHFVLKRYVLL